MLAFITSLLLANSSPNAVSAKVLAPAIIQVAKARGVDPVLLTRIILVESRGVASAVNLATDDHGLLQINESTRVRYGFSNQCLKNWRCNLDAGALILSDLLAIKGSRTCTFNLGPKGRFLKYQEACLRYERKIASIN